MWLRRAMTRTPHLIYIFIVLLVINGCCVRTAGQHLPTRDELDFQLHRNHPEIFYDTKLLPDGAEVTSYVFKRIASRYFFLVDIGSVPLTISVTPCSSVVSVTVLWRTMPDDEEYYYDDDQDAAAYDVEYLDELWQQADTRHPKASVSTDIKLTAKTGSDRMIYHNRSAAAGLYSVVVMATQRDTSLRLYATTTPHSDAVYPPLPADPVVRVTAVSPDQIAFAWKAPPATMTSSDVLFCVSVSSLRHFRSQCAAHAHRYGDTRPAPPPYAGFGFARERKDRRKHQRRTQKQRQTSATRTTATRSKHDSVYTCIGTHTNYTYRKPTAGRKYYIDVYAVNAATNASVTYKAAAVRTPGRRSSSGRLVDGRSSRVVLKTSRPEKTLKYQLTGRVKAARLNIYVRSCELPPQSPVLVQLEQGDGEVLATRVVDKSFEKAVSLSAVQPGSYRIKLSMTDGVTPVRKRRYRWSVLVSTNDRSPYPRLPADARVRLVNADCQSARVEWSLPQVTGASDARQRYCVYAESLTTTSSTQLNACTKPRRRRRSAKVSCHVTESQERGNETLVQTISGMKPGRRYAVDVYAWSFLAAASAKAKEFLVYERLIVDVPSSC